MTPLSRTLAVLCALVLLGGGARASAACSDPELKAFKDFFGATDTPLRDLASATAFTEACKGELFQRVAGSLALTGTPMFCPGERCRGRDVLINGIGALGAAGRSFCIGSSDAGPGAPAQAGCTLDPDVVPILAQLDQSLVAARNNDLRLIMGKLGSNAVPQCLLPAGCSPGQCAGPLIKLAWRSQLTIYGRPDKEIWLGAGGFAHLLFGTAFTCAEQAQVGDTCAIYSGANLMSHYCGTRPGPGFHCPTPQELLAAAACGRSAPWETKVCRENPGAATSECVAATSNPMKAEEAVAQARYDASCRPESTTPACRALRQKVEDIRRQSAQKAGPPAAPAAAPGAGPAPRPTYAASLSGRPGAYVAELADVYKRFGFDTAYFPPTDDGWRQVLESVRMGDPVQIDIDVRGWKNYAKDGGAHAVVLEGVWTDGEGRELVLVRDSNQPKVAKVKLGQELLATFKTRGANNDSGGAVGVCIPNDPNPGRCKTSSGP